MGTTPGCSIRYCLSSRRSTGSKLILMIIDNPASRAHDNIIFIKSTSFQGEECKSLSLSPPLENIIVRFGPLRIAVNLTVFKTRLLGRGFHTLIKNVSFSSPTVVESHNPPSLGAQRPRCHTARYLTLIPFVIAQAHR